jgi:DNA-binding MarR family transcriptional regulator
VNKALRQEDAGRRRHRQRTVVLSVAPQVEVAVRRGYSAAGEALTLLLPEVFRLNAFVALAQNRLTQDIGLSSARWRVVEVVAHAGRPQHVARLARIMQLTRQTVQALVNDLETDGYVAFAQSPRNRRAKLVVLTAKGASSHRTATRRQVSWVNRLANGIDARDIAEAIRTLRSLIKQFSQNENRTAQSGKPTRPGVAASRRKFSVHLGGAHERDA